MGENLNGVEDNANWKAPEMEKSGEPAAPELRLNNGRVFKKGDLVTVVRSDGTVEHDKGWKLASYGSDRVVVEKTEANGDRLQKVPTVSEFKIWQVTSPSGRMNASDLTAKSGMEFRKGVSEEEIRRITGA